MGRVSFQTSAAALLLMVAGICGCAYNGTFFPPERQASPTPVVRAELQRLVLTAADGARIGCVFLKPASEPVATIFLLQGSGSSVASWLPSADVLVDGGFAVFMMDYRGFGQSEGTASHRRALADAEQALLWLSERQDGIVVCGHSYGGQLAIKLAHGHQDLVMALVSEGAFTSHNDIATWTVPWWLKPMTRLTVRSPWKAKELIEEIEIPKLIIHSAEDQQVPFWMGEELYRRAAEPKQFWQIDGPHCCGIDRLGEQYAARIRAFLGL